jgi:RsmE family RNA methyltransferase
VEAWLARVSAAAGVRGVARFGILAPVNLILLDPEDFTAPGCARLLDRRARHVRKILHGAPGAELRVGLVGDRIGTGRIVAMDRASVELRVELHADPPPPSAIRLVLALPRPPVLRRLLAAVTAFGVKRIALLDTARVERSFWQSSQLDQARVEAHLRCGLEQARDTMLPEVTLHRRFTAFLERALPVWLAEAPGVVGHPGAEARCAARPGGPTTLIVGPEGGLLPDEIAALERAGVVPISLGARALSVESAVMVLLGRLGS